MKKKKSVLNGFQSLNLSESVLLGIRKRGYREPTPIQRKTIPIIGQGKDVVAMARTGSGKTACFLIPLFEKLKCRNASLGARALILSPTRELALQTFRFFKELGRYVGLKAAVILGGDSMDDQFSVLHGNPDVIVATLGRFLHVCVEMDLKLSNVNYVVFDEADRLFEMGFGDQLREIVSRLPDNRQTVLFSATLPKQLVEFSKVDLKNPVLIRMDVDSKIPSELKSYFIRCRPGEKLANLLVLLRDKISKGEQTILFAATKYHVEYLHNILDHLNIDNTYIYSSLDPKARRMHADHFNSGSCSVLIVTDIAARGIDIPKLDNVINYNFPDKPKLFVHRVGRCARAGRSGTSYSLITLDEYAYVLDLFLFLGRKLNFINCDNSNNSDEDAIGKLPQNDIEIQQSQIVQMHQTLVDLANLKTVVENAYKKYLKLRPLASVESNKRVKELPFESVGIHEKFSAGVKKYENESNVELETFLTQMKSFRPQGTVFEICSKNNSKDYLTMKEKRSFHQGKIIKNRTNQSLKAVEPVRCSNKKASLETADETCDLKNVFSEVVSEKSQDIFIPYEASDKFTETGLAVVNQFDRDASRACLDLIADDDQGFRVHKQQKVWDKKRRRMVQVDGEPKKKKIKTESGNWIDASYKTNRYEKWKEATKMNYNNKNDGDGDDDGDNDNDGKSGRKFGRKVQTHWARHNRKVQEKKTKVGLKKAETIVKSRAKKERLRKKSSRKTHRRKK